MSEAYDDGLSALRQGAQSLIAHNALALASTGPAAGAASPSAARQWWNLPAKIAAGRRIANEELQKYPTHNDAGDAMRHAEWSQRMAKEIGPIFSRLAGLEHEGQNIVDSVDQNIGRFVDPEAYAGRPVAGVGQTIAESGMDLRNNAAGIRAARDGSPIDPAGLKVAPGPSPY